LAGSRAAQPCAAEAELRAIRWSPTNRAEIEAVAVFEALMDHSVAAARGHARRNTVVRVEDVTVVADFAGIDLSVPAEEERTRATAAAATAATG
jgi:hypothetical protein